MKRKESKNIKTRQHPNDANLFWCSYHKEYHQRQEFSMCSRSPHGISYICRIANKICHYQSMLKREAIYAYQDKFGCRPSGKINWNAKAPVSEEVNKYMTYRLIKYSKGKAKKKQQAAA